MGTSASLLLVLFAAIFLIVFLIMKVRLNAFVTLIVAVAIGTGAIGFPHVRPTLQVLVLLG